MLRLLLLVHVPGLVERAGDDVAELRVHLGLLPEVLLEALHPLEVRDDDAARVGEDVRQDEHALVLEDLVRGRRDRAVRALADDLRLHLVGVVGGDHLLERARREHVAVEQQQLLVGDLLGALEAGERAGLLLVRDRRGDVDPVRVVQRRRASRRRAITVAPSSARNLARKLPTLPKPCTATRQVRAAAAPSCAPPPGCSRASRARSPRAVRASRRR